MLIIIYLLLFIILLIIILFAFPKFSPIPYFPTNKKDLPLIIKAFELKNNQVVFDLGAGDGTVIFTAAKEAYQRKLNTQFVAVDINPVLILIIHLRRLFHPNKKNIKIVFADMVKNDFINFMNFKNFITVYLYLSPWFLEKIIRNFFPPMAGRNFSVVSYMYSVPDFKPQKILRGKNKIFVYNIKNG